MKKPKKIKKQSPPRLDARIDLHGLTLENAFKETNSFVSTCKSRDYRIIEIITGRSGRIAYEFPFWMENLGCKAELSSHGGSFIVRL